MLPRSVGPTSTPRASAPLAAAYAITFFAFVDTFAFLPTIGPHADALGASSLVVGAVVGAYSATNLLVNPVAGVFLDRVGRRRLLLLGLALAAAALACYPLADSPGSLVAVRLLHGVGGGIIVPAVFTFVGDLTGDARRGRAMGRTGAMIGLAAIIAPPLATTLANRAGFAVLAIAVAGLLLTGLVVAAAVMPETHRPRGESEPDAPPAALRRLGRASLAVFGFTFALGGLSAFLPFRVEDVGGSPAVTGGLLSLFALVAAAGMLSPLADSSRTRRPGLPMVAGLTAVALALVAVGAGPTLPVLAVGAATFGLGYALVFPAAAEQAASAAGGARRGRAFGAFHAAFSLGFVIGPPIAGAASTGPLGPFTAGAVVAVLALLAVPALRVETAAVSPAREAGDPRA